MSIEDEVVLCLLCLAFYTNHVLTPKIIILSSLFLFFFILTNIDVMHANERTKN